MQRVVKSLQNRKRKGKTKNICQKFWRLDLWTSGQMFFVKRKRKKRKKRKKLKDILEEEKVRLKRLVLLQRKKWLPRQLVMSN
jgi:hypothetical protein